MFHRIGQFVVKRAWWVIAAWVVGMLAIAITAPTITAQTDEASFLPKKYESIQAANLQKEAFPASFTPGALALFERNDGSPMTDADKATVAKIVQGLTDKKLEAVQKIVPVSDQTTSKDGKYALSPIAIDERKQQDPKQFGDVAKHLRDEGRALASGTDVKFQLGGPAAQSLDQQDASGAASMLIGLATVVLVAIIVGIIFRSILAGILPLLVSLAFAMPTAGGLISYATKAFDLTSTPVLDAILIVVVLGVGTDYFLFLAFRYRERLRAGDDRKEAVVNAVARVGEAIASAAGAVTVAFAVLILSSLGMFKALGPALAIAVVVTAFAALTLAPALLAVIPARAVFWPGKKWMQEPSDARFHALGRMIQKRPALVAVASGGVLLALSAGALGYSGIYDLAGSSMPKDKESMVVQDKLANGFSAGAANPTHVYLTTGTGTKLDPAAFDGYIAKLGAVPGVAQAAPKPQLSEDGTTADFSVTLKYEAAASQAIDSVTELRKVAHAEAPAGTTAKVGGMSAVFKDIDLAMTHDYEVVFPIAGLLILLILGLQLRSVVAPWYLMVSVGLGFTATLGAATLLFQNVKGEAGMMFMLPILIYLFVVAIGTDYNILIIARLREEAREGRGPREAAREALRHGGPTVAAAGFILAASFGTFMLNVGNAFMLEFGFAMAFGIILAAFVMAMFFTPALTALVGKAAWWPGHGAMPDHGPAIELDKREPEAAGRR